MAKAKRSYDGAEGPLIDHQTKPNRLDAPLSTNPTEGSEILWLAHNGDVANQLRTLDWKNTVAGAPTQWPEIVQAATQFILQSDAPALLWWGTDRTLIYNDAFAPLLGEDHPRVLGQTASEIRALDMELRQLPAALAVQRGDDGVSRTLLRNSRGHVNGEVYSLEGTASSVGKRIHERRNRRVLQSIDGIVWEAEFSDNEFRFTFVSDKAEQILGYPSSRWIEEPDFWREHLHPDDRISAVKQLLTSIRNLDDQRHEYRMIAADGSVVWIRDFVTVVSNQERGLRWMGIKMDITRQRTLEQDLAEATHARQDLSAARSDFLAKVSHELRTPMTAIMGYTELLVQTLEDTDSLASVRVIQRNGEELVEIINAVLDLARMDAGRLEPEKQSIELRALVGDIHARMSQSARQKGLSFELDIREPLPEQIESDRDRLRQVFVSLLGNAIKFTSKGSVKWSLQWDTEKEQLHAAIEDTGIAITDAQRTSLFSSSNTAESTSSEESRRKGLGLAIAHGLAQLLGIGLWTETSPDGKNVFKLILPSRGHGLSYAEDSVPVARERGPAPVEKPKRILVVEDHASLATIMTTSLEAGGHTVRAALCGKEAIEIAQSMQPEVALLDLGLPDMSGFELLLKLKKIPTLKQTVWVALSGHCEPSDIRKTTEAGFHHHLAKPPDMPKLLGLIANSADGPRLSVVANHQPEPSP